ncbi:MAG: tRNA epoxyqueuosine(34) reductase QueG, partial [Bacteroidales bacterium]|jgi:epoxyqueuosine reductase|nr:tRNA epoxyqueuosine(34) reductase QueG [Bacteroidales bacterium]MBP8644094.1 tRNA epoxyqueuosine(34) reductase QueG [Bacteroidales bacterium]
MAMIPLEIVRKLALDVGFSDCGVSPAGKLGDAGNGLLSWLGKGYHGEMAYMERNLNLRLNPSALVPGAKSVISVILAYGHQEIPLMAHPPRVSRYALMPDYHKVMKTMLFRLLNALREEFGPVNGRPFVDSAPVLERAWAENSGMGWIGKNSNFIHPKFGSFVFIGELIVDAAVEDSSRQHKNRCGSCTRCMEACPTHAIVEPGVVDARLCISYLTIEKRSPLTEKECGSLNGWCFGCDICQEVCPWNQKLLPITNEEVSIIPELKQLNAGNMMGMTQTQFEEWFGITPLKRAGYEKLMQSVSCAVKASH